MNDSYEEVNARKWTGIPGSVILINGFEGNYDVAHKATCLMMQQCLRLSGSQFVGICVYGIEDNSTSDSKAFKILVPLSLPTLDNYKKLLKTNLSSYDKTKDFKLSEALGQANKMFNTCKKQLSSKTVILLSKLSIPPIDGDVAPTIARVTNLVSSNIDIKVINISEQDYIVNPFYIDFFKQAYNTKDVKLPLPVIEVDDIFKLIYQQSNRHLAIAKLTFQIGEGLSISVGIYNLIKQSNYQRQKKDLDSESNELVTPVTKINKITISDNMDVDDYEEPKAVEEPLMKYEILHIQEYGGERIKFTDTEKKMINNPFGLPMLKLLGFKPASTLSKEKWFLKTCYFLFPNEKVVEGSTKAFKALYQACTDMSVVAICVICTRVNAKPSVVALLPNSHPLGLDAEIGFDVIVIPFAEHLRDIPILESEEDIQTTEFDKNVMKDMIQNLIINYKPDMFENPKIQSEYRAIESIALKEQDIEPYLDTTKPNPQTFQNIQYDLFEETFGPFGSTAIKRPVMESSSNKRRKGEIDEHSVRGSLQNRTVDQYTVPQLKQILNSHNLSGLPALNGKTKNELVELVYKYCRD